MRCTVYPAEIRLRHFRSGQAADCPVRTRAVLPGNDSSRMQWALSPKREFAEPAVDPDPPDKRRRPPRANWEAPVFVDTWAAEKF